MITPSYSLSASERVLPKLALDFTTATLDPRVSFSRTTDSTYPATYINSSGLIVSANNNQPRFDYDPVTLTCKGLLIEESRTNYLQYSSAFENTLKWSTVDASISQDATTSPDGTTNADKFIASNISSYHRVQQIYGGLSGSCTVSFFAKAAEYTYAAVSVTTIGYVVVNLTNGSVAAITGGTATVTPFSNGWYRIAFTVSLTGGSYTYQFAGMPTGAWTSYTGNGTSGVYLWGGQLEVGAFATSYIPTTTVSLTRNADVAVMTGTNFSNWFNASEGTFVAKYIPNDPAPSNARGLFIADDGTANNLVGVSVTSSLKGILSLATANVGAGAVTGNTGTVNQVNTVSGSFKQNDYAAALNGGTVATSSTLALPTVTQARIGYLSRTGLYANATIQKLAFYPVRGINSQVQAQSK